MPCRSVDLACSSTVLAPHLMQFVSIRWVTALSTVLGIQPSLCQKRRHGLYWPQACYQSWPTILSGMSMPELERVCATVIPAFFAGPAYDT